MRNSEHLLDPGQHSTYTRIEDWGRPALVKAYITKTAEGHPRYPKLIEQMTRWPVFFHRVCLDDAIGIRTTHNNQKLRLPESVSGGVERRVVFLGDTRIYDEEGEAEPNGQTCTQYSRRVAGYDTVWAKRVNQAVVVTTGIILFHDWARS